ncbi:MAG: hypothetical protein JO112_15850 [Planctomycetes bacterium]|nr:hypothetical protein [Planctomycetota bacterium]
MKGMIREIMRTQDMDTLAEYLRERFGLALNQAHLQSILEQASRVGGPEHDPWSESTWSTWLKGKATQPPPISPNPESSESEAPIGMAEVEEVFRESSDTLLATREFQLCELTGAHNSLCAYPEEVWHQLFPAGDALGKFLQDQFLARGGRKLVGNAPFASWLYARLVFLGVRRFHEENDLGGYGAYFVVRSTGGVVGILLIEADTNRVEVQVEAQTSDTVERIKDQFIGLLLQDIQGVSRCEREVQAAEVGCRNCYGWTGTYFLGEGNTSR